MSPYDDAAPPGFCCPISGQLMLNPVTLTSGQTYQRESIVEWFAHGNNICPLTRQRVRTDRLEPARDLSVAIEAWLRQRGVFSGSLQSDVAVEVRPVEVVAGHFVLPCAILKPSETCLAELLASLAAARTSHAKEALLQQLILAISSSSATRVLLLDYDVTYHLTALTLTGSLPVRAAAAELLSLLSIRPGMDFRIQQALCALLPSLGSILAQRGQRATVTALLAQLGATSGTSRELAAWTLWLLSSCASMRAALSGRARQLAAALVRMMASGAGSGSHLAAAHLARASSLERSAAKALVKASVAAGLVAMLTTQGGVLQCSACSALSNLAFNLLLRGGGKGRWRLWSSAGLSTRAQLLAMLTAPHVLATLVAMLRSGAALSQRSAASLLQELAADPAAVAHCHRAAATDALVEVLRAGENIMSLVAAAASLQAQAGQLDAAAAEQACARGALSVLSALLQHKHKPLLRAVLGALASLTRPATVRYALRAEVIERVLFLLAHGSSNTQAMAARLLAKIGQAAWCGAAIKPCAASGSKQSSAVCREGAEVGALVVADAAALCGLVRLLDSPKGEHRLAALEALASLWATEANRTHISKVGGLYAVVEALHRARQAVAHKANRDEQGMIYGHTSQQQGDSLDALVGMQACMLVQQMERSGDSYARVINACMAEA